MPLVIGLCEVISSIATPGTHIHRLIIVLLLLLVMDGLFKLDLQSYYDPNLGWVAIIVDMMLEVC